MLRAARACSTSRAAALHYCLADALACARVHARGQVHVYEALGAIMEAMDVTMIDGHGYTGSVSANFLKQLSRPTTAILREARSGIVGFAFDTMLMMRGLPPRIEEKLTELYAARKAEHEVAFPLLLDAPGTFSIEDYPNHYAFCTGIVGGVVRTHPTARGRPTPTLQCRAHGDRHMRTAG